MVTSKVNFIKYSIHILALCICILATTSCGVEKLAIDSDSSNSKFRASRDRVVATARKELGDTYKYAGNGPERWDCSGLTKHSYSKAGIQIERSANGISKMAKGIELKNAEKGDLIFFKKDGRVFHVSIITENSKEQLWVVHSTTSRGVIEEDVLQSPYWQKKIYKVISLAALSDTK